MTTWKEIRKNIVDSIPKDELNIIQTLTYLQEERIKRGITQKELSQRIGMSQPQLAKIERLDSIPSLSTLNRYADGLDLEIKISLKPKTIIH